MSDIVTSEGTSSPPISDTAQRQAPLLLASGSYIRRQLLEAASVPITAQAVDVDENLLRDEAAQKDLSLKDTALFLARAKASAAIELFPHHTIIAADQILELEGQAFNKASDLDEVRAHLHALRGKTHHLHTALTLWHEGRECWQHISSPALTMRPFSDAFLENYLQQEGDILLSCVGCYRIEGPGIQLFEAINGSTDAIAGLPLLPLLRALRAYDILPS